MADNQFYIIDASNNSYSQSVVDGKLPLRIIFPSDGGNGNFKQLLLNNIDIQAAIDGMNKEMSVSSQIKRNTTLLKVVTDRRASGYGLSKLGSGESYKIGKTIGAGYSQLGAGYPPPIISMSFNVFNPNTTLANIIDEGEHNPVFDKSSSQSSDDIVSFLSIFPTYGKSQLDGIKGYDSPSYFPITLKPQDNNTGFGKSRAGGIDLNFYKIIKIEDLLKTLNILSIDKDTPTKTGLLLKQTVTYDPSTKKANTSVLETKIDLFLQDLLDVLSENYLYKLQEALNIFLTGEKNPDNVKANGIGFVAFDSQIVSSPNLGSIIAYYERQALPQNGYKAIEVEYANTLIKYWTFKADVAIIFKKNLDGFLNQVAIPQGTLQQNIDNKTNFGVFAAEFKRALLLLAPSWASADASSVARDKNDSKVKKTTPKSVSEKSASKTILEQTQSDLEAKQTSVFASNQIISKYVNPDTGATGTNFVGGAGSDAKNLLQRFVHQDFSQAMSVLDIIRDEQASAPVDKTHVDQIDSSTANPIATSDQICSKLILALPPSILQNIIEGLGKQLVEEVENIGNKIIDLGKLSNSDYLTIALAYSGVEKMFPLNVAVESAFLIGYGIKYAPDINIVNVLKDIKTAALEVTNFSIERLYNTAQMLSGGFFGEGSHSVLLGINTLYGDTVSAKAAGAIFQEAINCKILKDAAKYTSKTDSSQYTGELQKLKDQMHNALEEYQNHVLLLKQMMDKKEELTNLIQKIQNLSNAGNLPGAAVASLGAIGSANATLGILDKTAEQRNQPTSSQNSDKELSAKLLAAAPAQVKVQ
jgi:hypothetical protein